MLATFRTLKYSRKFAFDSLQPDLDMVFTLVVGLGLVVFDGKVSPCRYALVAQRIQRELELLLLHSSLLSSVETALGAEDGLNDADVQLIIVLRASFYSWHIVLEVESFESPMRDF